jgi:hypothetical protein
LEECLLAFWWVHYAFVSVCAGSKQSWSWISIWIWTTMSVIYCITLIYEVFEVLVAVSILIGCANPSHPGHHCPWDFTIPPNFWTLVS